MLKCELCGLNFENEQLSQKYLENSQLIKVIQKKFPQWNPSKNACLRCLRNFSKDISSSSQNVIRTIQTEEPTVITSSQHLFEKVTDDNTGACFITIHGPNLGKKVDLQKEETVIGRSETADIQINEENVSRQHAKVLKNKAEIIIEDCLSTNGTYVNTRRITSQALRNGDLILIGNSIFKFISGSNVEQQYYEEIYRLATLDGLTQIYNKTYFMGKLDEEFSRSRRYGRNLSIVMFDFDHFHILNNTYGHLAGDHVLKTVAQMIMRNMRKEDVMGRYGGEEFAILLPEIPITHVLTLAEKLRKIVEDTKFVYEETPIEVTISLGVATLSDDIGTIKHFLEKADQALYRAKADGRNLVRM